MRSTKHAPRGKSSERNVEMDKGNLSGASGTKTRLKKNKARLKQHMVGRARENLGVSVGLYHHAL